MKNFKFYPPKKQQDINLVPDSSIVGASALIAKSRAAKKKKCSSVRNITLPPFGPTQATGFNGDLSGNFGGDARSVVDGGYGNSEYGIRAYGEAISRIKITTKRKGYSLYSKSVNICDSID